MKAESLNVVYIGSPSFPLGAASTKRRRYMVDYMNAHGISSHVLITDFRHSRVQANPQQGKYGNSTYFDLSRYAKIPGLLSYYIKGRRMLDKWYDNEKKNVLIFHTVMTLLEYPFYRYALKRGYEVVFDQVETSYISNGKVPFFFRCRTTVDEWLSRKLYAKHPGFVISTALMNENRVEYPSRSLCILPNSTPVLCDGPLTNIHTPLRLLYSGTYAPKDGVGYLIDGVIRAHNSGIRCELILTGKGNPQDMKILEKANCLDYIKYIGYVTDEELVDQMLQSDVLCMTRINSKFANFGFPFKLSEYLAAGRVLLATEVGDVTRYVTDRESALVVPPEDSEAISDAIIFVAENNEDAIMIAQRGLEVVKEHFSIEKVGKIFVSFLGTI